MMVEIKNGRGLCMTCSNEPSCFHRARRGPALFCEMFDDYLPVTMRIAATLASSTADASPAPPCADEDFETYAGLCMNCDDRRTCGHRKPAGGIWHCEDYK